jgi:methyltransferase (TIGR00027 family)
VAESGSLIKNVSDTARWAAIYRAKENERPNAIFRDPFAQRLAGARWQRIAEVMPAAGRNTWAWVTRTYLFDHAVLEQVAQGTDLVINLAAGLDARPYRLDLPASLRWIEIDLPELFAYKEAVLSDERPRCSLQRVPLDLTNTSARRDLLASVCRNAKRTLILSEGLLIYFSADDNASLARDLANTPSIHSWILDLQSPGLLSMLQRQWGKPLAEAGSPLRFGPVEGPGFFLPHGWRTVKVQSLLKTAARLGRTSFWLRLLAWIPESTAAQGSRPWSGVCTLQKA